MKTKQKIVGKEKKSDFRCQLSDDVARPDFILTQPDLDLPVIAPDPHPVHEPLVLL